MSARHESDDRDRLERIGATVRQRALSGGEASIVGFTLVIYICLGAGLGYWLDKNLDTTYWIAIGTLAGAGVGFREMFRIIKKINADEERENIKRARENEKKRTEDSKKFEETSADISGEAVTDKPEQITRKNKPRIFHVPPPPQAGSAQLPQSTLHEKKNPVRDKSTLESKSTLDEEKSGNTNDRER